MPSKDLWRYATARSCNEMILSLKLLGESDWPPSRQLACLYALSNHAEKHYRSLSIPKAGGGQRQLLIPDPLLKSVQRKILQNVLSGLSLSAMASAYRKGRGIREHAQPHCGQRQVLRLDIRNFYDSITFAQVYAAFPATLFPPPVRKLLAELCCCRDRLPQGAPTSPALSNRVLLSFDRRMAGWCRKRGIAYNRYCDDMTFSGDFRPGAVRAVAGRILREYGFALHEGKTLCRNAGQRQLVTGVVVNDRPQVSRALRRELRQALHFCEKYGVAGHLGHIAPDAPLTLQAILSFLSVLQGRVAYLLQINPQDSAFLRAKERIAIWRKEAEENPMERTL